MDEKLRICALYSHGPHYRRLLRFLHQRYADAHITALVPPDYPAEHVADDADAVLQADTPRRDLRGLGHLLRQIRRGKFDVFVVMFDSPRLRILSALTGVPRRYCYSVDGRYERVRLSLLRAAADAVYRNVRGRLTYAYVHWVVYHRPVKRNDD